MDLPFGYVRTYTPVLPEPDFKAAKSLEAANEERREFESLIAKETLWACTGNIPYGKGCGKLARVADTDFIQTFWYVEPYSCTGGDYYNPGEVQAVCPECGHRTRFINGEPITGLKKHGKSIKNEYDK